MSREERRDALLLAALAAVLFGWLAPQAGLRHDDYGFWADFENSGPAKLLLLARGLGAGRGVALFDYDQVYLL